jgi:fatty acid desaturase
VFATRESKSWAKLAVLATGVAVCLIGIAHTGWLGALFFVPAAAVCCTSIAMLGHEGSHRSFSVSPVRNALLVYLVFPLFSGLGSLYWRDKHDRRHHAHPNVETLDPDIKPFPFSSSRAGHEACGPRERFFQRYFQRWLFWPMATLMATGMRRSSVLHLARGRHERDRAWWIELGCMTVHYVGWFVVPSLIWGPLITFAVYMAIWGVVGVFLAMIFAPAHMGLPIHSEANHDWEHQLATTRNLELPRFISFFFIGLDYQVEHHLFPRIPHQNLPEAARITRAWCVRNGINHQSAPYLTALASAERFMRDAWSKDAVTSAPALLADLI